MLGAPMDRSYVEELRIQSYGCIQDATFRFTPLHALIGPNDSGKSTVLRALRTMAATLGGVRDEPAVASLRRALSGLKGNCRLDLSGPTVTYSARFSANGGFQVVSGQRAQGRVADLPQGDPYSFPLISTSWSPPEEITDSLVTAQLLRLDPDFLRAPHALIRDGQPLRFLDERGTGLPALYDALIVRNLPAYMTLNQELIRLFPSVKSIQLANPSEGTKAIGVKLVSDAVVPAELMSEGMLYYLAFAVLPYLDSTALLLVEEPENGLHPARIAEVMRVLRAISEKTQVILATHSPLVINELRPEEVTVVTRSAERGTKATSMKDTANFEERSKVYALGELWLSYANGEDEGPLLDGGPRP
jgi:energy-coupling factor transporter ATP-binding protein EcfA2